MDAKDILSWCFIVGALDFGVFGFLYSNYASAIFQSTGEKPPIVTYLRRFCRVTVVVLIVLTGLSAFIAYSAKVGIPTWIVVGCFVALAIFSIDMAFRKME